MYILQSCITIRIALITIAALYFLPAAFSQVQPETIYSKAVLYKEKIKLDKFLRDDVITATFALPLDSSTEYRYEGACSAITQYLIDSKEVEIGLKKMFVSYARLEYDTRRALLEALYALDNKRYKYYTETIIKTEKHPKLFAMCAVYLYRADSTVLNKRKLFDLTLKQFPANPAQPIIIAELLNFISNHNLLVRGKTPGISALFSYQQAHHKKVIYSFQRWNRDYRGLAIIQNTDGSFIKDRNGRLVIFEQLARSASDLPYFITNGSTPQGVYRITGTAVSGNSLIGPTPNLQLLMPYEGKWEDYLITGDFNNADTSDRLLQYLQYFPGLWRKYEPIQEVFYAGKIGRTEIIAHGTTIDPAYFIHKPFYPLTPTMGCLCAREQWNVTTGNPAFSEQLNIINAWTTTPERDGLLYVINVDNQQKPLSRIEVEKWVSDFEQSGK